MNHLNYYVAKSRKILKYLAITLLTLSMLLSLARNDISHAQDIRPTRATFARAVGTIRVYPNGRTPTRTPAEQPDLISDGQRQDRLWVAGDRQSWAHMIFSDQGQRIDPVVHVGTVNTPTLYRFPCLVERAGSALFAWDFVDPTDSACNTVTANFGSSSDDISLKASSLELANGDFPPQITVTRSEPLTLIHIYDSEGDLVVDVLVGAVQVISLDGLAIDVSSGNRYIQSLEEGRVEPIDLSETVESSSVETFLNEENWPSDIFPLLNEMQIALQQSSSLTEEQQEILDTHNRLRAEVSVPPLAWSDELAAFAQEWANQLSGEDGIRHRGEGGSGTGENIAAGNSVSRMLSLWADEKDDYNDSTGTCYSGRECRHYTQMVWRNTTQVGCGLAPHRRYGGVLVCNYSPPGNYIGQRPY